MAKKRAKQSKSTARKPQRTQPKSKKDQTIELRLPDELYDKVAKLEKGKLTSILKSVLGKEARVATKKVDIEHIIKHYKISRLPKGRVIGMKPLADKCQG
jgi:hypothetical protein